LAGASRIQCSRGNHSTSKLGPDTWQFDTLPSLSELQLQGRKTLRKLKLYD